MKTDAVAILAIQTGLVILFGIFATYAGQPKNNNNNVTYTIEKMYKLRNYVEKQLPLGSANPHVLKIQRCKFALIAMFLQSFLSVFFVFFTTYSGEADASDYRNSIGPTYGGFNQKKIDSLYHMFQDIHVMIFIGFGFLMTFLKKYGYSAVGFNFLLGALVVQWAIICQGFYELNSNYQMEIGLKSLYEADIAAATVLISMGAVLGRTSYLQLLIMGLVEIAAFTANSYIGTELFQVSDAGGSIFVHTFGAYFGLTVSYMIEIKKDKTIPENSLEESGYTSDLFAMIGTIFLWLFWPSFNAIELSGDDQQRAIINTYLSLTACCITTFALSLLFSKDHKFDMVHIQNSTLAGGVAVGASANLMLQPYGAILVGIVSAILSVAGYAKLTPFLSEKYKIRDTCGVNNLHGMPGLLAGIISSIMAALASEQTYHQTLYEIYPARAALNATPTSEHNFLKPGLDRSAATQAGYQLLALVITLAVAVVSGLITGLVLNFPKLGQIQREFHYDDALSWRLPEDDQHVVSFPANLPNDFTNTSFDHTEEDQAQAKS